MLVLKRDVGEAVVIGDDIRVMVVKLRGNQVRLGIEAPAAVAVHRQEVYDAIHRSERRTADDVLADTRAAKSPPRPKLVDLLARALLEIRDQDWRPDPRTIRMAEAVLAMHPDFDRESGTLRRLSPIVELGEPAKVRVAE